MGKLVKAVSRQGRDAKPTFDESRFLQEAGAIAARLQTELTGGLAVGRASSRTAGIVRTGESLGHELREELQPSDRPERQAGSQEDSSPRDDRRGIPSRACGLSQRR